jgi:SpoVK/Ycf46/Vps4 family AAA+-type ATPase
MSGLVQNSNGMLWLSHADIRRKIAHQKLFGLENFQNDLFHFCKTVLTADSNIIKDLDLYDLSPSVLLYGPPNTGKTTLCYWLFNKIKQDITSEIDFYSIDIGQMLDPSLGQSSRNLSQIFKDLKEICQDNSSAFLLLDELDAFCMTRSRSQEHDAIRRAMTTLMIELDDLKPSKNRNLFIFGITNIPNLVDTAVVRRFSLKEYINVFLSLEEFKAYIIYLSKPLKYKPSQQDIQNLYDCYEIRKFTVGDIKSLYKSLYVNFVCKEKKIPVYEELYDLFKNGFSTSEHLEALKGEL